MHAAHIVRPSCVVASVLVISADPSIESLMGQLVAFAGHRPIFDPTLGAAGEAVRRARPEVVLLDSALPEPVVQSCLDAAAEVIAQPILTSSCASETELAHEASIRQFPFFALPGAPKPLADVIDRAVEERERHARVDDALPSRLRRSKGNAAMCAALASMTRARALATRARAVLADSRTPPSHEDEIKAETQRSVSALRAAVIDYTHQLMRSATLEADAVALVHASIADCAAIMGAEGLMRSLFSDSADWVRHTYRAA